MLTEKMPSSREDLHVVCLESDRLRVILLPEIGCKIASIIYKANQFEALARPLGHETATEQAKLYARAYPGAPFDQFDLSGIDDCIPTIDACRVEKLGRFADHGDAWSRPWNVFEEDRSVCSVKAFFRLSSIPLYFERHVRLEGSTLFLSYRLLNESIDERPWLWALHGLCHYEPDAILSWPEPYTLFNAHGEEPFSFDPRKLSEVPQQEAYKFYLTDPVPTGKASIFYPSQHMRTTLQWDAEQFPYLGGWINTGGSPGSRCIALEPTNGFYDRLDRAIANDKVGRIAPGAEIFWQVQITIEEVQ
ncbi:hypothetical protein [Murdochiella vaginalis]|uniref:hypothetical protein n=1 Tax=Murdochiella vaginalis TaxID=1852373 RepID=UPI0008FE8F92|nr:hypothetical protein [Murdochiella vaginalis]